MNVVLRLSSGVEISARIPEMRDMPLTLLLEEPGRTPSCRVFLRQAGVVYAETHPVLAVRIDHPHPAAKHQLPADDPVVNLMSRQGVVPKDYPREGP